MPVASHLFWYTSFRTVAFVPLVPLASLEIYISPLGANANPSGWG